MSSDRPRPRGWTRVVLTVAVVVGWKLLFATWLAGPAVVPFDTGVRVVEPGRPVSVGCDGWRRALVFHSPDRDGWEALHGRPAGTLRAVVWDPDAERARLDAVPGVLVRAVRHSPTTGGAHGWLVSIDLLWVAGVLLVWTAGVVWWWVRPGREE